MAYPAAGNYGREGIDRSGRGGVYPRPPSARWQKTGLSPNTDGAAATKDEAHPEKQALVGTNDYCSHWPRFMERDRSGW